MHPDFSVAKIGKKYANCTSKYGIYSYCSEFLEFFFLIMPFMRYVQRWCRARKVADNNMALVHRMLNKVTNSHSEYVILPFSVAAVVARMCLIVTLQEPAHLVWFYFWRLYWPPDLCKFSLTCVPLAWKQAVWIVETMSLEDVTFFFPPHAAVCLSGLGQPDLSAGHKQWLSLPAFHMNRTAIRLARKCRCVFEGEFNSVGCRGFISKTLYHPCTLYGWRWMKKET
jgi:hypothetical protein